jgi:glycosyltransferase involved in cell wall biosynthesis
VSFNLLMLLFNTIDRFTGSGFRTNHGLLADRMFSSRTLRYLRANSSRLKTEGVTHIFSYNYYAADIFRWAKANGFTCVLGQIDAGPAAGKLVKRLAVNYGVDPALFHDHYEGYLEKWKIEVECASQIVVNSEWSKKLLVQEGVPGDRIKIIPLAFDQKIERKKYREVSAFSDSEPLAVLFLGSLQIQKGVIEAFEAAEKLATRPVVFSFAGTLKMPEQLLSKMPKTNCTWLGFQSRAQVTELFAKNHVLLFPTHSDGFGLVQLEAMGHGVPVITSTHCGTVVKHNVNGLVLNQVSSTDIVTAINTLLDQPALLNELAAATKVGDEFSFSYLTKAFNEIN